MAYLVSLHLQKRRCLVVGGGKIAARKVRDLWAEGAIVTVISPQFSSNIASEQIICINDVYRSDYLEQVAPFLVFAATDQPDVNRQIVRDAKLAGILVNSVDGGGDSDFDNVMQVERAPITIGISTGGASPALAVHLRDEILDLIGDAYPTLSEWLGDLRPQLKHHVSDASQRHAFWEQILHSDILPLLKAGEREQARASLIDQFNQAIENARPAEVAQLP